MMDGSRTWWARHFETSIFSGRGVKLAGTRVLRLAVHRASHLSHRHAQSQDARAHRAGGYATTRRPGADRPPAGRGAAHRDHRAPRARDSRAAFATTQMNDLDRAPTRRPTPKVAGQVKTRDDAAIRPATSRQESMPRTGGELNPRWARHAGGPHALSSRPCVPGLRLGAMQ